MKTVETRFLLYAVVLVVLLMLYGAAIPMMLPNLAGMLGGNVIAYLNRALFELGGLPVTPLFLAKCLLFLLALTILSRMLRHFLQRRVLPHTSMEPGQQYALARFSSYLFFLLGLTIGLQSLGVDLSSLVVLGGALGVGIGLGLQGVVSNFVSGLILLVERPVKVGDSHRGRGHIRRGGAHRRPQHLGTYERQCGPHRSQLGIHHRAGDQLDRQRPPGALFRTVGRGLRQRSPSGARDAARSGAAESRRPAGS